jgi:hypothetical protein
MRLLKFDEKNEIILVGLGLEPGSIIPPSAILSHTYMGLTEVTF